MPHMYRMFVAMTEHVQPVFSSNEASFFLIRPFGLIRRTRRLTPSGRRGRVLTAVNSAVL
ncbi:MULTISPECIES: hypothetical protein [unclassified Streptomyces]|uniref:hypothetical protein n=1 Tax=unclassified Streptomyces TaxID=2593676 RepID=UPI00037236C8|nr:MULTISPECIES: hypothetical protein [unclassified Streptomyces]MYX38053.1 hypothetical protein [Streptomyces sp. SID8377]